MLQLRDGNYLGKCTFKSYTYIPKINTKSSIDLEVDKSWSKNASITLHFLGCIPPVLEEKWTRVDNFTLGDPQIFLDELMISENETIRELSDIHLGHADGMWDAD